MKEEHWIYILELANGAYYTGYTCDMERRYRLHRAGRGSRTTRSFPPLRIVQSWKLLADRGTAMKVEALIKKKGRRTKELLIASPDRLAGLVRDGLGIDLRVLEASPRPTAGPASVGGPEPAEGLRSSE